MPLRLLAAAAAATVVLTAHAESPQDRWKREVKKAGVDLASPAPYRSIVARMDRIMDEIEAIQARRAPKS